MSDGDGVPPALPGADRQPRQPSGDGQHYIGVDLNGQRISVQTAGAGAAIVRYVQAKGIGFVVAATWPGGRQLERQLKNRKHASRFCPVCHPDRDPTGGTTREGGGPSTRA